MNFAIFFENILHYFHPRAPTALVIILPVGYNITIAERLGTVQKLVTIYLDNHAYMGGKFLRGSFADKHGFVEEHLTEYLSQGWKIADIHSFGGSADMAARGWIVVLLEKQE